MGLETMSLVTLLPFFGMALILALSNSSYLGPAMESVSGGGGGGGGEGLQSKRDGEGVGIMDKRS